jgi:hypothetical protein
MVCALPQATAQRKNSTPLAKASPTVEPCLASCEQQFSDCEALPQATTTLCPQSRRICIERCDPAVLSSDTLKGLKRTPEELRYKPLDPQSPLEQCRQGCQDRRALCLGQNQRESCDGATEACYSRCADAYPVANK